MSIEEWCFIWFIACTGLAVVIHLLSYAWPKKKQIGGKRISPEEMKVWVDDWKGKLK